MTRPLHTSGSTWPLPPADVHPQAFAHAGDTTIKSAFPGGEKAVYRGTVFILYQLDDVSRADEAVYIILNSLTIIGTQAGKDIG